MKKCKDCTTEFKQRNNAHKYCSECIEIRKKIQDSNYKKDATMLNNSIACKECLKVYVPKGNQKRCNECVAESKNKPKPEPRKECRYCHKKKRLDYFDLKKNYWAAGLARYFSECRDCRKKKEDKKYIATKIEGSKMKKINPKFLVRGEISIGGMTSSIEH